ncbi:MAG: N-acetyl-alpha-D-glucosaminyl L-malate synthase BshA [bacterium]|nr:N-acetyl-alpha-D-glucosaminyl L-malate synthase BshA [bacterium]
MRIGVTCYPSYGGSGVVGTELGMELARRGHAVHFICYDTPFRLDRYQANIGYHEVNVPAYPLFKHPPYLLALTAKMVEIARYESLDILHVHYAIPHATSACLAREITGGRLKVVTTLHGTDITLVASDPSFRDVVAHAINQSDGVTAVSEDLRRETLESFAVRRELVTIPNFVNPDFYRRCPDPALRARFAPEGERVLVHVSNFRPVKRAPLAVRVLDGVNRQVPSHLLMVGDGPEVATAHELARELGVADRVHFLGRQEQVVELLSLADLFLLPSEQESFGLAALEAMACEVPVVASRVGGLPEVVADGVSGFLVPPQDLPAMVDRAVAVLSDPALQSRMAKAARRAAVSNFAAETVVARYEDYLRQVLG